MVRWSGECQVNVKSQSKLDIGGRETCYYLCSPQYPIIVSNQVQITMIYRLDLTFPRILFWFSKWNEQWAWNLRIWWDFVTLWLMQMSGKFVKYSMCIYLVWDQIWWWQRWHNRIPTHLVKQVTVTHYQIICPICWNSKSASWQAWHLIS